jgi:hypothetical protein
MDINPTFGNGQKVYLRKKPGDPAQEAVTVIMAPEDGDQHPEYLVRKGHSDDPDAPIITAQPNLLSASMDSEQIDDASTPQPAA